MTESIYDAEIAPALAALAAKCQEHNMPFLAIVEYEPTRIGRTEYSGTSPGMEMQIIQFAARCYGNVDSLIIALKRYGMEHGHNSVFLNYLEKHV